MNLAVFYHVYTDGEWRTPWFEFLAALDRQGFPVDEVNYGIAGRDHCGMPFKRWATAGGESVTINALHDYAQDHDGAVLYAHTKGAAHTMPFRDRWRRSMTNRLVANWRENLTWLEMAGNAKGEPAYDAVGCHWLTEAEFGSEIFTLTRPPFFGGNFWMARCDYLRTLPECPDEPRYEAERWIGLGNPRVVDLLPGWPHDRLWPELMMEITA